jgi:hypothetical protein
MNTHENSLEFNVIRRKGKLFLDYGGWTYDLSPPDFVRMVLPPNVSGVDAFLLHGSKTKGIVGDFKLKFDREPSLECDAEANYIDKFMDGWTYEITSGGLQSRKAWVCNYMTLFFKSPPEIMYITILT